MAGSVDYKEWDGVIYWCVTAKTVYGQNVMSDAQIAARLKCFFLDLLPQTGDTYATNKN